MKLTTIALASVLAMSGTYAFAQAGEGDANVSGGGGGVDYGYAQPSYGSYGFSRAYGAVIRPGRIDRHPRWSPRYDRRGEY